MAGLARMANRDHRFVEIEPRATRSSSAPAPSRATRSTWRGPIDNLFKAGANVYYHAIKRAHVSGHASQEELKLMLNLTKPRYIIPDPRRVPDARPARPPGGRGGRRSRERLHHRERPADRVPRPTARLDAGEQVSRPATSTSTASRSARSATSCCATGGALAKDGMFLVVVTVDKQTRRRWSARPEVVTRGFVAEADEQAHRRAPLRASRPPSSSPASTSPRSACSRPRSRTASRATSTSRPRRRPLVFPVIVEV